MLFSLVRSNTSQFHFTVLSLNLFLSLCWDNFCGVTLSHVIFWIKKMLPSAKQLASLSYMYAFENKLFLLNFVWSFSSKVEVHKVEQSSKNVKFSNWIEILFIFGVKGVILPPFFPYQGTSLRKEKMWRIQKCAMVLGMIQYRCT